MDIRLCSRSKGGKFAKMDTDRQRPMSSLRMSLLFPFAFNDLTPVCRNMVISPLKKGEMSIVSGAYELSSMVVMRATGEEPRTSFAPALGGRARTKTTEFGLRRKCHENPRHREARCAILSIVV